jgi:enoyl-CoA hydratase/carnithine racemase
VRDVITEIKDAVLTVTFNRPAAYNAMTFEMYDALYKACVQADANDAVRVMVLRGAGDNAFVAGTDIPQLEQYVKKNGGVEYETRLERVVARLESVTVPVIAAVDGVAAGAGVVFVLAADLCICTASSCFGAPIARTLGNCLSIRNCERLVQAIGVRRAKALLLTADLINAEEAFQAGLVREVVKHQDFEKSLYNLTNKVSNNAPLSLYATKKALQLLRRQPAHTLTDANNDLVSKCYKSTDFLEGLRSFQEKRKPNWTGN